MRILVVLPRFPYPLEKGDKLRAYHQIRILSQTNEVYLFCADHKLVSDTQIEALKPFCKDICVVKQPILENYKNVVRNYLHSKSLQIGYWDSQRVRKAYRKFEQKVQPDVVYSQMVRTMPWVSRSQRPKVMDFQDALSMNTERRMNQAHGLWHYILHFEFKMLRSSEYNAFKIFDALTIISDPDGDAIPHRRNREIQVIPNGVDTNYFKSNNADKQYDVVFCGNMNYPPNINACKYLLKKVMPLVWREMPETKVLIAGHTSKKVIWKCASDRVTITGWVDDIRECYDKAKLMAAPMQIGSGLQNKLLEAMAMHVPCVTTSIANDSLHATPEKEILIGDTPEQLAAHIMTLLRNDDQRRQLAQAAYQFVTQNYSWEQNVNKLNQLLLEASSDKSPRLN
ncbi:MAG: glycosyltransferase [Bacteroidales bacterium]|nr:glycosyltransferase [Candidatus Colimorpha onthohippi]